MNCIQCGKEMDVKCTYVVLTDNEPSGSGTEYYCRHCGYSEDVRDGE